MKHLSRSHLAILVLISAMLACNIPGTTPSISVNDQAATAIALTLQAQPTNGEIPITATSTLKPLPTVFFTATSTATASTVTITPTYSTPMITVLEQTNCREGPGQDYQVLFTYVAKKKLEIIGRYDPTNFWLVKAPESKTGVCWMWGQYVKAEGSYWMVPTVTPPPTATVAPPTAPSITKWDFSCSTGTMTFTVQWDDRATNETGYRIFRNGEQAVELPANSTSFTETIPLESGKDVTYYLQVFAPSGTANSSLMKLTC
jgi:hypothetical protein